MKQVLVSHLHADHIGGVKDFSAAEFLCHEEGIELIRAHPKKLNLKEGFLPDLLPADIIQRTQPIQFKLQGMDVFPNIAAMQGKMLAAIFGDDSAFAIPIPGHATGMTGLIFKFSGKTVFLCADTTYHIESIKTKMALQQPSLDQVEKRSIKVFNGSVN